MRIRPLPFVVLLGLSTSASAADSDWVAFALAPDETVTAVFQAEPATLVLRDGSTERKLPMPEMAWPGASNEPHLMWSPDSDYLAIEAAVEEDTTQLEVVDARTLKVVWKGGSAGAAWLQEGHRLLVVPAYEIAGPQEASGLLLLDPASGVERAVAKEYHFTGRIDAGKTVVVADVARDVDGLQRYSLERIDLAPELQPAAP